MQECHKLNAHTVDAHTMYAWSTQETLKLHTCHNHLHHRCHICHIHKYAAGMPKAHTVCILNANRMPHIHACMLHSYFIYCMHTNVMHTAHSYSACMHTITTYAGYLLLHVYFMQSTWKHFPWMHKLMLHSHKPFTVHANFTQAHYIHTPCRLQAAHV